MHRALRRSALSAILFSLLAASAASVSAAAPDAVAGYLYVNNNAAVHNSVAGFARHRDGTLTPLGLLPLTEYQKSRSLLAELAELVREAGIPGRDLPPQGRPLGGDDALDARGQRRVVRLGDEERGLGAGEEVSPLAPPPSMAAGVRSNRSGRRWV